MLLKFILVFLISSVITSLCYAKNVQLVDYLQNPLRENLQKFKSEDEIIKSILNLQKKNGGVTYNIRWGNQEKQNLFVVSLFPDLGDVIKGNLLTSNKLQTFIEKNIELLLNPRCALGTWYNKDDNKTYVDISAIFFDKNLAIKLANKYNQIAIWDLQNNQEIKTDGNGSSIQNLPKIKNRIPPLKY